MELFCKIVFSIAVVSKGIFSMFLTTREQKLYKFYSKAELKTMYICSCIVILCGIVLWFI